MPKLIVNSVRGGKLHIKCAETKKLIKTVERDKSKSSVVQASEVMGVVTSEVVSQNMMNKGVSHPTKVSQGVVKSIDQGEFAEELRNFCTELDTKLADKNYAHRQQRFALVDKYDPVISNINESISQLVTSKSGQNKEECEIIDEQIKELQKERKDRQAVVYKDKSFKQEQKQLEKVFLDDLKEFCESVKKNSDMPSWVVDTILSQRSPSWVNKKYQIKYHRKDEKMVYGGRFQKQGEKQKPTFADILDGKKKAFQLHKLPKNCESKREDRDSLYRFSITVKGNTISGIVRLWNPPYKDDRITSFVFNGKKLLITREVIRPRVCPGKFKATMDLGWRLMPDGSIRVCTCLIEDGTLVTLNLPPAYLKDHEILNHKLSIRKNWRKDRGEEYEHLCKTIKGLRRKMHDCVDSCYKQFVAALRRNNQISNPGVFGNTWCGRVGTIVSDTISLSELAEKGKGRQHNANRQLASVYKLKDAIEKSGMKLKTCDLWEVKPSQKCTSCGFLEKTDKLIIVGKCGHTEDRDYRSCYNTYEAVFGENAPVVIEEVHLTPNYHGYNSRKLLSSNHL